MHAYYVCDYCGHVHTLDDDDDRAKCESCGDELERRARFDWLADVENYSRAVIEGRTTSDAAAFNARLT